MNKEQIQRKREKEQKVVDEMIRLYCHHKHHTEDICEECAELSRYARERSERCPFMEEKTFCANCKVHCYKPEMREKIKTVMRYSGPRMIFYHPLLAIWHLISAGVKK